MAENTFIFGAGAGQAAPTPSNSHQENNAAANLAAAAPLMQQTAFQQNGQLPGIDMTALAGISPDQVALIARLLQSGQLPLPPPPPVAPGQTPAQAPAVPRDLSLSQHSVRQQDDVDMVKEDGEVEEGEATSTPAQSTPVGFSRTPPTGPRNDTSRRSSRRGSRQHPAPSRPPHSTNGIPNVDASPSDVKEQHSREFVLAMHQAGYSYKQLAQMMDNPKPLRSMFKSLGLPVSSDHELVNDSHPARPSSQSQQASVGLGGPTDAAQKAPVAKAPGPPKPAAKADRTAYLQKLQALKAGKAGSPNSATAQAQARTVASEPSAAAAQSVAPPTPSAATSNSAAKAVKTELARQRLEAFKAQQAAKQQNQTQAAAEPSVAGPSAPQATASAFHAAPQDASTTEGLGAGLSGIANIAQQLSPMATPGGYSYTNAPFPNASPVHLTPSRSFSGLPGLFMSNAQQQTSPAPPPGQPLRTVSQPIAHAGQSPQRNTLPTKRLMTSGSDVASPQPKRPFGQSRSASEDESFIIENSDDEDEDSRMHIDGAVSISRKAGDGLHGHAVSPQNFSSKGAMRVSSISDTPVTNAPGSETYEQKCQAIDELNRKIAEKEAKAKVQAAKTSVTGDMALTPSMQGLPGIPGLPLTQGSLSADQTQAGPHEATNVAPERPASAAALKLKQQKEELRQRIAELENARRQQAGPSTVTAIPATPQAADVDMCADIEPVSGDAATDGAAIAALPEPVMNVDATESEDGEVEDESDFDFYGDEELEQTKPSEDPTGVGSQATTVSAVTELDVTADQEAEILAAEAAASVYGYPEMAEGEVDEEEPAVVEAAEQIEQQPVTEPNGVHQDAPEPMDVQVASKDSSLSVESEEMESGSSSEEDDDDLDAPVDPDRFEVTNVKNGGQLGGGDVRMDEVGDSTVSSSSADEQEYDPQPTETPAEDALLQPARNADDDLASELQPGDEQAATEQLQQLSAAGPKRYYTPYESILMKFKDYRYHPWYLDNVPGGYRSWTYSHQIDPQKQMCPTEQQGGICRREQNCASTYQHFDKFRLNDNMLLQQMGTKNIPARSKDEITKWNAGLQEVITSLKAANVRDATTIAARIAQYRRDFVGDPSKIVHPS